ncbi:type 1 glutamine amidotransferase domain-containing protein [Psychroserpens ponticola]|uniref:Type 1 glutamine amidotransferase domain-containing protein n=1 Tax=Psychroserpens ponticola TaxID=2932268 RepID=A0ABY7S2C5_9FLAO|nr:type 1 glutamine amidotransferase domain-containing protein [Psychroserpens ponticola]WCO03152.1 type 1 glutamine amidotransferase domain-containing protein [Psychroserpens ponticola]
MFKKFKILKWIGVSLISIIVIVVCFVVWFVSLLPPINEAAETTVVNDLPYLSENIIPTRGKILAVVTSTDTMGASDKKTGYELTELSRAYYVFEANGFEVDVASPLGGQPPVVIDDDDMSVFDFAFLNDSIAQEKIAHTIPIKDVIADNYQAIYFVGGKGAMFDFPNNTDIQAIVKNYYQSNKVIGAVCHGPAALVNVTLDNGKSLLENKTISAFTNEEELLLISDAKSIFPFLLQDEIIAQGANFNEGIMYLENVSQDQNLITGQNPWSTWLLAEQMIKQLGYAPKYRAVTAEENAISVLSIYYAQSKDEAKAMIENMLLKEHKPVDRMLLAQHTIVSLMKSDIGSFFDILGLVSYANACESKK